MAVKASSTFTLVLALVSKKLYGELFGKVGALLVCHHLLVRHVALIAEQDLNDLLVSMLLDVPHPGSNVVERFVICHIIHKEDAHRSTIVRLGNRPESLLPRCVPNLQLDFSTI